MKLVSITAALLLLTGCIGSRGFNPMSNESQVELSNGGFEVVASGLRGEASCAYLFGFIPLGETTIATRAMDQLVASAGVDGKSRGLVNFSYDQPTSHFLLFSVKSVKIRADVVEFE